MEMRTASSEKVRKTPRGEIRGDSEAKESNVEGLIICKNCQKLVPEAIVCIYCGEQLHPLG